MGYVAPAVVATARPCIAQHCPVAYRSVMCLSGWSLSQRLVHAQGKAGGMSLSWSRCLQVLDACCCDVCPSHLQYFLLEPSPMLAVHVVYVNDVQYDGLDIRTILTAFGAPVPVSAFAKGVAVRYGLACLFLQ